MSILLQRGVPPWQGTATSVLVETFHFQDIPLIGLFEQNARTYLFRCVAGEIEGTNLWSYTLVTDDDVVALDDVEGAEFDAALEALSVDERAVALAIALDGFGIVGWVELSDCDGPAAAVDWLVAKMQAFLHEQSEQSSKLLLAKA